MDGECLVQKMEQGKRHRGVEGGHGKNPKAPRDQREAFAELVTFVAVAGTSEIGPGASGSASRPEASALAFELEAFASEGAAAELRVRPLATDAQDLGRRWGQDTRVVERREE